MDDELVLVSSRRKGVQNRNYCFMRWRKEGLLRILFLAQEIKIDGLIEYNALVCLHPS